MFTVELIVCWPVRMRLIFARETFSHAAVAVTVSPWPSIQSRSSSPGWQGLARLSLALTVWFVFSPFSDSQSG